MTSLSISYPYVNNKTNAWYHSSSGPLINRDGRFVISTRLYKRRIQVPVINNVRADNHVERHLTDLRWHLADTPVVLLHSNRTQTLTKSNSLEGNRQFQTRVTVTK